MKVWVDWDGFVHFMNTPLFDCIEQGENTVLVCNKSDGEVIFEGTVWASFELLETITGLKYRWA